MWSKFKENLKYSLFCIKKNLFNSFNLKKFIKNKCVKCVC